ncbi:urotensin II-related peptide [Pungitius pungitius]|uniref:urotensin II-related peptide n=1 Tax=Pungitius pungitius TaxID=134920 RepID=UPI002E15AA27
MLNSAAQVSVMKVGVMMMMLLIVVFLGTGAKAAPTERGFVKPPPSPTHAEKYSGLNPGQYLKHWLRNTRAAGVDGTTRISDKTTTRTMTAGSRGAGRGRSNLATAGPDKQAQMLKMISALEELERTYNSTLSSRITIIPRANGRNSGRRNKVPPAPESGVKPTTAAPAAVDTTASRASIIPRPLTGRNFKKSLAPQTKKPNKRVCFWKYCSQN